MADISTFISAVKPRERTDQYVILSALFVLDAHVSGVTAKQVRDLLGLHLRKNAPSNVNASLRAYAGLVTPIDKGPPIRWSLTNQGVDRLRSLSGLSLSTTPELQSFKSDIGVVCALEHPELSAVLAAGGGRWTEVGDSRHTHVYRETRITTSDNLTLRVVATTATSMGLTAAAIATTHLILLFQPRIVAMIGIAAGTRGGARQFGDVLVADPSVDYNSGKVAFANGIREFQPDPYPIGLNPRLRSVLLKYVRPTPLLDQICRRWSGHVPASPNRLHVGPVGAADQVIDDASRVLEIQKNWRKLIGVEMETYGVYRAANEAPEPRPRVVSFKSVCDFAAEKSDNWQDYAAFVAAEFAFEFFKHEWSSLWPKT